jgi:hypothetical protein
LYFNCFTIYTSNIYTNVFRVKRIELELGKPWYKRFVTWSHALSHLGMSMGEKWVCNTGSIFQIWLSTQISVLDWGDFRVVEVKSIVTWMYSFPLIILWLIYLNVSNTPYSFFSPEKWIYTEFSPRKNEYILRFPPRKNEYILNFPPGKPSMC